MKKIKSFVISIIIMLIISVLSLLLVSVFTYLFKWQADKAMIGIMVTYALAGFAGGYFLGMEKSNQQMQTNKMGKNAMESLILSLSFMCLLILCSVLVYDMSFVLSERFFISGLLVFSSSFLSGCIKRRSTHK